VNRLPLPTSLGNMGPIAQSPNKSFHTTTPDNYDIQISNVNSAAMRAKRLG
jgi:hypothetical protein